jgi:nucleoid-associated protein YgaU
MRWRGRRTPTPRVNGRRVADLMIWPKAFYWAAGGIGAAAAIAAPILYLRYSNPAGNNPPAARDAASAVAPVPANPSRTPFLVEARISPVSPSPSPGPALSKQDASDQPVAKTAPNAPAMDTPSAPQAASPAHVEAPAPPAARQPAPSRPAFDVVRVEPSGEAVVAGHAEAGARVQLLDNGRVIAEAGADDSGQFVILPPALPQGGHRLELAARGAEAPVSLSEATNVEVALAPATAPAPPAPSASPKAFASAPSGAPQPDRSSRVSVQSVEASEAGRLEVKGFAGANAIVRLYLNGAYLADAVASAKGLWSLTIEHGMAPGRYDVRADAINGASGAVIARAQVPFAYPQHPDKAAALAGAPAKPTAENPAPSPPPAVRVASRESVKAEDAPAPAPIRQPQAASLASSQAQPAQTLAAPGLPQALASSAASAPRPAPPDSLQTALAPYAPAAAETAAPMRTAAAPADVVIPEVRTATVVRGDSLWRLSQRHYRDGLRYRQIYIANSSQIRNPDLIYPGQIFVIPKTPPA